MAISNFSELQSAIDNWLHRTLDTARVQEIIALGEAKIRDDLRVREMEFTTDLTVSSSTVSLPSGYLGARRLYLDGSPKRSLKYVTPEHFYSIWASSESGPPKVFTAEADSLEFGPSPDQTYTGKLLYWKLDALSDASPTQRLLTNNPNIYLYASLSESAPYTGNDERLPMWETKYAQAIDKKKKSNRTDRYGGQSLQAQTATGNP